MRPEAKPVLPRSAAMQMVEDLGTAIHNIVSLAEQSSDSDKVLAMNTLLLLQTKRNVLESEVMWSNEAATGADKSPGEFDEPTGLAEQERGALNAVEALQVALADFTKTAGTADYAGSAKSCAALAGAAQLAATELTKTAACYEMARAIGNATAGGAS
jgi:hypothetical protein